MAPIIRVEGLTKTYKRYQRKPGLWGSVSTLFSREHELVTAIDRLSFGVQPGARMAYIGPNGAGKSTTLKILTGVMRPTAGHCEVAGVVPYRERIRNAQNIGVVFGQRTQLWWDLPVADSFAILKRIYQVPDAVYEKNLRLLRQWLDIDEVAKATVRTLSLGQRMRIEIAASFLHDPKVVFLDEPTIGLDAVLKQAIRGFIKQANEQLGTTVVLTSHDMDDIQEICEQAILIDRSRIVYEGPLAGLKRAERERAVMFVYRPTPAASAELQRLPRALPGITAVREEPGHRVRVSFLREGTDMAALIGHLFRSFEIADFYSLEPDLESVIRQIYRREPGLQLVA